MILPVYHWPSPRLREVAEPVDVSDPELHDLVDNLRETMYHCNGVGLSATQCGIRKRVFVADCTVAGAHEIRGAFVNPEILDARGAVLSSEGCLSFPGVGLELKRPMELDVQYWCPEKQAAQTATLQGLSAVCFAHELDHLNGRVFFDHVSGIKRRRAAEQLRRATR